MTARVDGAPIRVLLIEDNPGDARLITEALRDLAARPGVPAFELACADRLSTGLGQLAEVGPDVVILDLSLPDGSGLPTLMRLRAHAPEVPVVVLTGLDDEELAVRAVREGAQDYLVKGQAESALLGRAIRYAVERACDQAERAQLLERERAARAEAEHRAAVLAAVFESMPDAVYVGAADGISMANGPALAQFGVTSLEELNGNMATLAAEIGLRESDTGERLRLDEQPFVRALGGERAVRDVLVPHRVTGEDRVLHASAAPIRVDGMIIGAVCVNTDITERTRAEEALRESEEQLRQAQKMEAVGQLAGGVAHDFNNLLTVIKVHSEFLLEELDPSSSCHGEVEEIQKAAARAAALTRQLLAFSRKQVLQPGVLDLNAVVADVAKMLRRLLGEDIQLSTLLDPALGQVMADPGQIEQVLINLAVNARDAMPKGGALTIKTANVELDKHDGRRHVHLQPGPYVLLVVSDTGCGMDEATRSRAFEPFFTTKEPGKGTGLGLSTVYGIVQQSGGHIRCESERGHGTTFHISFPRLEDGQARHAVAGRVPDQTRVGSGTVLLVEDEEAVRRLARRVLERNGYRVLEARHGTDALQLTAEYPDTIHLVLTDSVMPGMSGREMAERFQALRPGVPVLFMSGYTDDEIIRRGLMDPGTAFLQKPFTAHSLTQAVRKALDASVLGAANPSLHGAAAR